MDVSRKVRCGKHGKKKWKGDFVCVDCNAIWICEPAADPAAEPGALQFRLQNTHQYTKGHCVCGSLLFDTNGVSGSARVACAECVAKTERAGGIQ
jgi:hypothetical protein